VIAAACCTLVPRRVQATSNPTERLGKGLSTLEALLRNWDNVTVDCSYAEIPREILESKNKEKLLLQATQNALFDKSSSINVCKSTVRVVRQQLGTTADSPLSRIDRVLGDPALLARVAPEDGDTFVDVSERLQAALRAADAAAFASEASDFSARTPFQVGEVPSTPSLDPARENLEEACALLKHVISLCS